MLLEALDPQTRYQYGLKAKRVLEQHGGLGYDAILDFITCNQQLDNATLRGYKSACLFALRLKGIGAVMSDAQSADLDKILDGHLVGQSRALGPKRLRGAVDDDKLEQLVQYARKSHRVEIEEACVVASGCALRNQDIERITSAQVDVDGGVVHVWKHDSTVRKARTGFMDERPITTKEACCILRKRIREHPTGPLWPGWNRTVANKLVQDAAKHYKWPSALKWDGLHCVGRHGAAIRASKAIISGVQKVGAWRSEGAAAHYGRIKRH